MNAIWTLWQGSFLVVFFLVPAGLVFLLLRKRLPHLHQEVRPRTASILRYGVFLAAYGAFLTAQVILLRPLARGCSSKAEQTIAGLVATLKDSSFQIGIGNSANQTDHDRVLKLRLNRELGLAEIELIGNLAKDVRGGTCDVRLGGHTAGPVYFYQFHCGEKYYCVALAPVGPVTFSYCLFPFEITAVAESRSCS